jgi:hypothetical protein
LPRDTVSTISPGVSGIAVNESVRISAGARLGNVQVNVEFADVQVSGALERTNDGGNVSVIVTDVAASPPLFVTATV